MLPDTSSVAPLHKDCLTFRFEGEGGDYARLWLACTVLNVLSLGLYVPWAKVRLQRYLLNHTWFAGGHFDYHADPRALLKGRLLVLAVLLLFSACSNGLVLGLSWSEYATDALLLLAALLLPWFTVQSLRFHLSNSSWNQLRLRFDGSTAHSYRAHLQALLPLLPGLLLFFGAEHLGDYRAWLLDEPELIGLLCLLAGLPWARQLRHRFLAEHHALGPARLQRTACLRRVYLAAGCALFAIAAMLLIVGATLTTVAWFSVQLYQAWPLLQLWLSADTLSSLAAIFAILITASGAAGIWNMTLSRELQNHTSLLLHDKRYRIEWWMSGHDIWLLHTGNVFRLLGSLGLAWPWVRMRTLRFRLEHMGLFGDSDLAQIYQTLERHQHAQGEEMINLLGMELGW